MTTIPRFRLSLTQMGPAESAPTEMVLDFSEKGTPDLTLPARGGFEYDRATGKFELQWGSLAEFDIWREDQERTYSIELRLAETKPAGTFFLWKRTYKCARNGSPDDWGYQKKFPDRIQKLPSKRIGCSCQLSVKAYPGTTVLLGHYIQAHNHPTNLGNIVFTRVTQKAKGRVRELLEFGVEPKKVVCNSDLEHKIKANLIFRSDLSARLLLTTIATNILPLPMSTEWPGHLIGKRSKKTLKTKSQSVSGWLTSGRREPIHFSRTD